MSKITIDGIPLQVKDPEQTLQGNIPSVSNITSPTELGESLKELNKDSIETNTRMSGIDMRARLHPFEISYVLALDSLVALGVLPTSCLAFTRQKKRLSVSLLGKGREEIVNIVAGKREQDAKMGMNFGDRLKGFFGANNEPQVKND